MGKKSLIKSTTKKKTETKAEEGKTTEKTAAKAPPKAPAKTEKKTAAATPEAADAARPIVESKPARKKLTAKEILFMKFDWLQPDRKKVFPAQRTGEIPTAPPLITATDPQEVARLRSVLAKRFSMDEIKAAAKAPETKPAEAKKPEPQAEDTKPGAKAGIIKMTDSLKAATPIPAHKPTPKPVEKPPFITVEPMEPRPKADPVSRSVKFAAAAAALVVLLLLAVSANNSSKYNVKSIDNAIEIWKGDFSPKDNSFFMVLHGVQITEPVKDVYSKKEVFPLIFNYYVDKSDALLEVKGLPDFDGIKKYLHQAEEYAVTTEMRSAVIERLNTIERMILLYKADVAISRNTVDSLDSAIIILKDADKLTPTAMQSEEIAQKIAAARAALSALKTEAPAEKAEK